MKYGWKQSSGNLGVDKFETSDTIMKLGSNNNSNIHIIPEKTPISNQFHLGSCVANAGCDMWEILYGLEHPDDVFQLSRLFLYWNARLFTKDTDKDEGTYIHHAMESLKTTGVCLESTWPYDTSQVFAQPNIIAYKEGDDNTLSKFYQILSYDEDRLREVEAAVRANHPVIFGTQVSKELENYISSNEYVFGPPKNPEGGHAILITGVRINASGDREFLIRNSWGANWGLYDIPGHAWFSSEYIISDMTRDLFVGTKMDNLLL